MNTTNATAAPPGDRPMSRDEAAAYLGLSRVTLACWAARRTGPAYCRSGSKRGRVWYRACDLDAWMESRQVRPRS